MKKFPKILLIPILLAMLAVGISFYLTWERPLMDVLPKEVWTHIQVRDEDWEMVDEELAPFLEALRQTKVSRDDSLSHGLSSPYMEFRIFCGLSKKPTLLCIQSSGDIAFAVHMDTDHYQYYEGGQELFETLLELGFPTKQ